MEGMIDDDAQWIILIGFIISIGIFFLAIIINQSVLVGQTTAESVIEFPKADIQDLRSEVRTLNFTDSINRTNMTLDITALSLQRKNAVVDLTAPPVSSNWKIHYNNGITSYDETIVYWDY